MMATGAEAKNERFARCAASLLIVMTVVAASASACMPEGRYCSPGDYVPCKTSDGSAGAALCNDEGTAYGACDPSALLDGSLPPAPDAGDEASTGDGGPCGDPANLGFLCPCSDSSKCESKVCNTFPSRGMFCTHACTKDTDCAAPSPGCTPKGLCKVP